MTEDGHETTGDPYVCVNWEIVREGAPIGFASRVPPIRPDDSGWVVGTAFEEPSQLPEPATWVLRPLSEMRRRHRAFNDLVLTADHVGSWVYEQDERRFVKLQLSRGEPPADAALLLLNHRGEYLVDPTPAQVDFLLTGLKRRTDFVVLTREATVTLQVAANGDGTYDIEYLGKQVKLRATSDAMIHVRRVFNLWDGGRPDWDEGAGLTWTPFEISAPQPAARRVAERMETMADMNELDLELRYAVHGKDPDRVRELVARGANLEAADEYGRTPLQRAVDSADQFNPVGYGTPAMVVLLLELGADPNTRERDGHTPLFRALQQASTTDDVMSRALLGAGADLDVENDQGSTVVSIYERSPSYAKAGLLYESVRRSREPMHLLAEQGDGLKLRELFESGADVNRLDEAGYSVLAGAVSANRPEAVRLLLDAGADPNVVQGPGRLPLLNAAIVRRYDEVIKVLVEGGADPDLSGGGRVTPRELADKVSQPYFG